MSRRKKAPLVLAPPKAPELPADLVPLVRYPGGAHYKSKPLDLEQVRSAIWHSAGSIHEAAQLLDVAPARLQRFITNTPSLATERKQASELVIDKAEHILIAELDGANASDTARWILDRKGTERGWGSNVKPAAPALSFGPGTSGQVAIRWESDD